MYLLLGKIGKECGCIRDEEGGEEEEVMTECGCYDFGTELDCYKQALNYIRKHLTFEPNNACAVLAYVQDNFKCYTPEIVRPETPETFPPLTLPTPDPESNDNLPDKDEYDEDKRKPIWWYHTDHLGSSTYLTDNFGRPSHYYETLPFGEMMVEHNQSANVPSGVGYDNKYKFNGKELDDATQMYYYGARYYDPRISIFVSVDPLAEKTMTPYQYVTNNPIMFTDPTGMEQDGTEHDYRLTSTGKIELLKETNASTHTIYNEKDNSSITFNKEDIVSTGTSLTNPMFNEPKTLSSGGLQTYQFTNPDTSESFYRYVAKFSNVEFGKFDGYFGSDYNGFVFTENKRKSITNGSLAVRLSNLGYIGLRVSHSHPSGNQAPSGYYNNKYLEGLYLQPDMKQKSGDRANSMYINSLPGFENAVHEVYSPIHDTFTRYYGNNRAENPTKNSVFDSN